MTSRLRSHWRRIIFQSTRWDEKAFDVFLIIAISLSVIVVMLESVPSISSELRRALYFVEWGITILFTLEYILRLYVSLRPLRYARSFFGVVDLLSILPTYLDLLLPGAHYLALLRVLRVLRIFRVLKLAKYIGEANVLIHALRSSLRKIAVFIFTVIVLVLILGSLMYLIEGEEHGFTSIPKSVYWAIVTLTTVGYGDISPQTPLGQLFASFIMITGYGIIAVPTAIVTAEMTHAHSSRDEISAREAEPSICPACGWEDHDHDAAFCKVCGDRLPPDPQFKK
ncbi:MULTISPECIES: ion transporter [unclassified Lentimonas]|uniref:ion transporter n=1 Tax=unclassified Lentimonas TaxID=2630993 RepID=UPI00132ADCD5|nr:MULTISPECIES: ion transporter [unclassified Lentimonas]CAA6677428.1 Potassium voltage-gated channel subfamily KQT; possible potassium channel, VIC family [Lentimonas sp. CC4]CAA6686398.1 Potassium voltage-gated channel subfamily KQT; possible potassium channel, VIC family [Lentimonas sp. CC6]CAA6690177.1 Potassium voltage-gated channel subfamily KQT; possible potassium channel, VIC family [Lentimonas sp. CC19]CAA6690877.1 Potassium voltage-gated channel subfamily KQT; possible potassium chan